MLYTGSAGVAKLFQYQYDPLNRLTRAVSTGNSLNEAISYDIMGNITAMTRLGVSAASLGYSYQNGGLSNQLQAVTSGTAPFRNYLYDGNGNARSDGGTKNISYNLLNLPLSVTSGNTTLATYTYDANGSKLRNVGSSGTWDYIDGIVYNNNTIQFVQTEEGRALNNGGGSYLYQYYLKDHLGNTRVTFTKNADGTIKNVQENEYYSLGLSTMVSPTPSVPNNYLYNGKEVQVDLVKQLDYGARYYDPVIGRFTTIDRFSSSFLSESPYQYASLNPVNNIDFNGDSTTKPIQLPEITVVGHRNSSSAVRDGTLPQILFGAAVGSLIRASDANQPFSQPAYKAGTWVRQFAYNKYSNTKFVRVFRSGPGGSRMQGRWIMRAQDIQGLSPKEIQSKFSLPQTPNNVAEVSPPNGTIMQQGVAAAAFDQQGGGIQYQLMNDIPEISFQNPIPIISSVISTPIEVMGPLEVPLGPIIEP